MTQNKLKLNEEFIEIFCSPGDTETVELAMQIPYIHRNRKLTKFTTTGKNIDLVLKLFRGVDKDNIHTVPTAVQRLYDKEMQRRVATNALLTYGPSGETVTPRITLRPHQQLAKELAEVNDKFAFFYDTRTGKTPMSLSIISDDIKKNPGHKWLILCPLILIENAWLEDAKEFYPDLRVVNLHDTTKAKRLKKFQQDADVYIQNIESFITYKEYIEKLNIHGAFVDESSTMKSHSSKFSKAAVDYSNKVKRWYLLSGTPAPNGENEYYRQIQSVDYYSLHQSYTAYKQYFFNDISYNPQYEKLQLKPERKNELYDLLKRYSLYVDKEDVLQTPGREFRQLVLTMPDDLKAQYKKLKKELYLELGESVTITAPSTAASINKLNQMTSGFVIDTQAMKLNKALGTKDTEVHIMSEYRFDALEKLLDEIGDKQVLIWAHFRKEFEIIKQRLGDKCALVYGGTSLREKSNAIQRFKRGDTQYLVANPASADKGLTLTNAHYAIYFSNGYSYELYKQSMERIYGDISKQPNKCIYYAIVAKGTVDEAIYGTLQTKGDMSMAILNHLKGGG